VVAVLSRPRYTFAPLTSIGATYESPKKPLPFRRLGHAFAIKRNFTLDPSTVADLENRGYTVMVLNKRTIYLNEKATGDDWNWVDDNITAIDENLQLPNRFLSHQQYYGYSVLLAVSGAIAGAMRCIAYYSKEEKYSRDIEKIAAVSGGRTPYEIDHDENDMPGSFDLSTSPSAPTVDKDSGSTWVSGLKEMLLTPGKIGTRIAWSVINPWDHQTRETFFESSSANTQGRHGKVVPFRHELALPDTSFIGDIIARSFMTMLGETVLEQMDTLSTIRKAAGAIKLTRAGEELAHFYRCVEISIEAQCGMSPIFTGSTYDGSVLYGGIGSHLIYGETRDTFDLPEDVNEELKDISIHGKALREISSMFPSTSRAGVLNAPSMVELRRLCLENSFKSDDMALIVSRARSLDFGIPSWQVTPDRLRSCFRILNGKTPLTKDVPISAASLFSKDMALVALSVFEEGQIPSWNIPSGTLRKLTGRGAPTAPSQPQQKRLASGGTDDGPWVMEMRGTKLDIAVEDFKSMVSQGGYRSIPSSLAKKQHYRVFQGSRMDVFWSEMQDAYAAVDSNFKVGASGGSSATIGRQSPGAVQGQPAAKRRRLP